MPSRTEARRAASEGRRSSTAAIWSHSVGTAARTVTPCASAAASARRADDGRDESTAVAPAASGRTRPMKKPRALAVRAAAWQRSPGPAQARSRRKLGAVAPSAPWAWATPFGRPVVPEV